MSTAIAEVPAAKPAILLIHTDATIKANLEKHLAIKVKGIDDKEGYDLAQAARMECRTARTSIEKKRVELNEEHIAASRAINAEAKRLTALIEPIEKHLLEQQESVENEKARLKLVAEDKLYAERLGAWTATGAPKTDRAYLLSHNPEQFEARLVEQREAKRLREQEEADRAERERKAAEVAETNRQEQLRLQAEREAFQEQQRKAAEETARLKAIEDEKFAAQRAELDKQKAEQEAAQAKIKAEQDRLAKIDAERLEAERLEAARLEAAEQARIETEARLKREQEEAEAKRLAEEEAAKRAAAILPVKQKLTVFADGLLKIDTPELDKDTEAKLYAIINGAVAAVRKLAKELA